MSWAFWGGRRNTATWILNLNIPRDIPTIQSDKGQLQQVLLNIVNNALARWGDGGELHIMAAPDGKGNVRIAWPTTGSAFPRST